MLYEKLSLPESIKICKFSALTLKGTFLSGAAFAPKKTPMPGYAMIGAIIESEEGNIFVKMTGSEAAVTAARDDLKKLLATAFTAKK